MLARGQAAVRRAGALAAAVLAVCAVAAAPARALDVSLEGETLSLPDGEGAAQPDRGASGGSALRVFDSGVGAGSVTVPQSTTHVFLRARASECAAPPWISLRIDGVERLVARVSTGGYGELGARLSIPAGARSVAVAVTSDSFTASPFCDRSTWIDRVTIIGQPFAPDGWRNARLSKRAPIARNSKLLVAELRRQIRSRPRGALIGTSQYSSPFYVVPHDQPRVRVAAPPDGGTLHEQWAAVPLPPDAIPAAGTDANLAVWQPSTDTMWEFWGLARDPVLGTWRARFGGRMPRVSRNEGHFVDPPGNWFGATATSITLLAGTQRIEELRRGVIDHAVDFAVIHSGARDGWCWPAQRTDQPRSNLSPQSIPAGARFRLPPQFDLAEYVRSRPLSRYAMTVARAVQRYGLIVRDTSSEIGFFAEDPTPLGWDPYPEIFEGQSPDSLGVLRNFPWKKLQVVAPPHGRRCVDDPDPD